MIYLSTFCDISSLNNRASNKGEHLYFLVFQKHKIMDLMEKKKKISGIVLILILAKAPKSQDLLIYRHCIIHIESRQ